MTVLFLLLAIMLAGLVVAALTGTWGLGVACALGVVVCAALIVAVHAEHRRWR